MLEKERSKETLLTKGRRSKGDSVRVRENKETLLE